MTSLSSRIPNVFVIAVGITIAFGAQPMASMACAPQQRVAALGERATTDDLRLAYDAALSDLSCGDAFRSALRNNLAGILAQEGFEAYNSGGDAAAVTSLLEESNRYQPIWTVQATLGEIAQAASDYVEATRWYQSSLATMDDETLTPQPPDRDTILRVVRLAEDTALLAPQYVAAPSSRSGEPTGLAAGITRGVTFSPVRPIEFFTDQTVMTDKGQDYAEQLVRWALNAPPASLTIIGHTDDQGPADYNMGLSMDRAERVASYLFEQGFYGRLILEGRGEEEPRASLSDNEGFTLSEVRQINRRVEVE